MDKSCGSYDYGNILPTVCKNIISSNGQIYDITDPLEKYGYWAHLLFPVVGIICLFYQFILTYRMRRIPYCCECIVRVFLCLLLLALVIIIGFGFYLSVLYTYYFYSYISDNWISPTNRVDDTFNFRKQLSQQIEFKQLNNVVLKLKDTKVLIDEMVNDIEVLQESETQLRDYMRYFYREETLVMKSLDSNDTKIVELIGRHFNHFKKGIAHMQAFTDIQNMLKSLSQVLNDLSRNYAMVFRISDAMTGVLNRAAFGKEFNKWEILTHNIGFWIIVVTMPLYGWVIGYNLMQIALFVLAIVVLLLDFILRAFGVPCNCSILAKFENHLVRLCTAHYGSRKKRRRLNSDSSCYCDNSGRSTRYRDSNTQQSNIERRTIICGLDDREDRYSESSKSANVKNSEQKETIIEELCLCSSSSDNGTKSENRTPFQSVLAKCENERSESSSIGNINKSVQTDQSQEILTKLVDGWSQSSFQNIYKSEQSVKLQEVPAKHEANSSEAILKKAVSFQGGPSTSSQNVNVKRSARRKPPSESMLSRVIEPDSEPDFEPSGSMGVKPGLTYEMEDTTVDDTAIDDKKLIAVTNEQAVTKIYNFFACARPECANDAMYNACGYSNDGGRQKCVRYDSQPCAPLVSCNDSFVFLMDREALKERYCKSLQMVAERYCHESRKRASSLDKKNIWPLPAPQRRSSKPKKKTTRKKQKKKPQSPPPPKRKKTELPSTSKKKKTPKNKGKEKTPAPKKPPVPSITAKKKKPKSKKKQLKQLWPIPSTSKEPMPTNLENAVKEPSKELLPSPSIKQKKSRFSYPTKKEVKVLWPQKPITNFFHSSSIITKPGLRHKVFSVTREASLSDGDSSEVKQLPISASLYEQQEIHYPSSSDSISITNENEPSQVSAENQVENPTLNEDQSANEQQEIHYPSSSDSISITNENEPSQVSAENQVEEPTLNEDQSEQISTSLQNEKLSSSSRNEHRLSSLNESQKEERPSSVVPSTDEIKQSSDESHT